MKTRISFAVVALFAGSPVLAHSGAHIHPHGFEGVALGLALIAGAVGAIYWTTRK